MNQSKHVCVTTVGDNECLPRSEGVVFKALVTALASIVIKGHFWPNEVMAIHKTRGASAQDQGEHIWGKKNKNASPTFSHYATPKPSPALPIPLHLH